MVGSLGVTLSGCHARGEECLQKFDSHHMWRKRWERGETRHGGSKHMPIFVVVPNPQNSSRWMFPHGNFALMDKKLSTFQQQFTSLKMPFDYSSSMANHVSSGRFSGMKAHDWHVLMQQLLLLCLRGLMQDNTCKAIMHLSRVF
jgi:hypothetical protein